MKLQMKISGMKKTQARWKVREWLWWGYFGGNLDRKLREGLSGKVTFEERSRLRSSFSEVKERGMCRSGGRWPVLCLRSRQHPLEPSEWRGAGEGAAGDEGLAALAAAGVRQPEISEAFSLISSSLNSFYIRYHIILPLGVRSSLLNGGLFPICMAWLSIYKVLCLLYVYMLQFRSQQS